MAKFKGAILRCQECGNEFKVPSCRAKSAKYCSKECADGHRADSRKVDRVKKKCPQCGKEFYAHQCQEHRRTYCSYECANKAAVKEEVRICAYCGEPFTVNPSSSDICCSWGCRVARSKTTDWPTSKKILCQCVQCGKEFYRSPSAITNPRRSGGGKFCSRQCSVASRRLDNTTSPSFYGSGTWYQARKRILERDNYTCQQCGFKGKGLAVHHVELKRNGGTEGDDNLITLCAHCHRMIHWENGDFNRSLKT